MVMTPPGRKGELLRIALELALLKGKEKLFGKLSEAERERMKKLMRELMIIH